jgi:hypothetical protein
MQFVQASEMRRCAESLAVKKMQRAKSKELGARSRELGVWNTVSKEQERRAGSCRGRPVCLPSGKGQSADSRKLGAKRQARVVELFVDKLLPLQLGHATYLLINYFVFFVSLSTNPSASNS